MRLASSSACCCFFIRSRSRGGRLRYRLCSDSFCNSSSLDACFLWHKHSISANKSYNEYQCKLELNRYTMRCTSWPVSSSLDGSTSGLEKTAQNSWTWAEHAAIELLALELSGNMLTLINALLWILLVLGWAYDHLPMSTQPGHPSMGRHWVPATAVK